MATLARTSRTSKYGPKYGEIASAFTVVLRPLEAPQMFRKLIWDVFRVHKMLGCYYCYIHRGFSQGSGVCADYSTWPWEWRWRSQKFRSGCVNFFVSWQQNMSPWMENLYEVRTWFLVGSPALLNSVLPSALQCL
jgi:hypothetical protein